VRDDCPLYAPPTKQCRGCTAMIPASDPTVCERCDLHRIANTHPTLHGYGDPTAS
jgi:hypothetical protein